MPAICSAIAGSIDLYLKNSQVQVWLKENRNSIAVQDLLSKMLRYWSETTPKPTVLLLDEVDALVGDTLISLLRQIRAGYAQRPEAFPQSIILCGVRDVRDYRLHRSDGEVITGGSAFHIEWPLNEQQGFLGLVQRIVLELKILRPGRKFATLLQEGITQTQGYAAQVGADEAHLIIFDRNPNKTWSKKIWRKVVDGLPVWGC